MTSQARQSELYARLQEVLGAEQADTLMTMLPMGDRLATRADLKELKTDVASLKTDVASLKTDVASLESGMSELRQDMRDLRGELRSFVRTFVVAQTTAMVGLTGIFIGVNQLL